jgi:PHD/YefM family antitoxin component YafN of YafNO toxin-antitoxin module
MWKVHVTISRDRKESLALESPALKPQFVTDENGERVAVILSMAAFEEITELLEDLADSREIERRKGEPGIPHEDAMRMLRENIALPD